MRDSLRLIATLRRVAAVAVFGALALSGQTQSAIQGMLRDSQDGSAVAGLAVAAVQIPDSDSQQPSVFRTSSDSNGAFSLAVPAGRYRLCTEESGQYVDPCQWSPFAGSSGSSYDFSMLVPAAGQFNLEVGSNWISLADSAGTPLASNASSTVLDTSAILSAWANTPPWLPFWLSSSHGLPSTIIGFTVYGLLN